MINSEDLKTIREFELEQIRKQEDELWQAKESFVKGCGWHKEEFQGLKCVEVYWCKDEDAIGDIDRVIELIAAEIEWVKK